MGLNGQTLYSIGIENVLLTVVLSAPLHYLDNDEETAYINIVNFWASEMV